MGTAGKAYFILISIFVLVIGIYLWKVHKPQPGAKGFVETINAELAKLTKMGPTDPDKLEQPKIPKTVTPAEGTPPADAASSGGTPGADTASGAAPVPATPPPATEPPPAQAASASSAPTPGSMGDAVRKIREKSEKNNQQLENSLSQ